MNMFKNKKKRIRTVIMGIWLTTTFVMGTACSTDDVASQINEPDNTNLSRNVELNVWATSSLSKVLREGDFADELCDYGKEDSVHIEMARNEYESAQIILSANSEVKEYTVSVTDLSDGKGNTLNKEAIEFFHQKYVNIEKKTVTGSPYLLGEYPEALVPMAKAVEHKENNVPAGKNQGIWLTVKTEHETVPGTYHGTATVKADGTEYDVPVAVTVWDVDVSDEFHCTYISTYTTTMAFMNEGDATQEFMKNTNEFLLDFRVCNEVHAAEVSDLDSFVDGLARYKDVVGYYTYLPFYYNPFGNQTEGFITWDVDVMRNLLMKIIDRSVEDECLYPDMVWFYPYWYDEWQYKVGDGENAVHEYLSNVRDEALFFNSLCEETVAMYDKCYGANRIDSVDGLRESILGIKKIMSGEYSEVSAPYLEPYDIMTVSNVQLNEEERAYIESIQDSGLEFMAYNCNNPKYPRLASHIDNSFVEIRIFGWQMYDFGATGMLYHRLSNDTSFVNIYENTTDIMDVMGANGDGVLVYPGVYYGMETPVASTRLHMIRDSLEDYEYLYELEKVYDELSDYYDTEISADGILDSIYYTLYADNPTYIPNRDVNVFYDIRKQVFQSIVAANSADKMVLESKYDTSDKTVVKMLFSADCQLQDLSNNPFFKSQETAGQGIRYTFEFPKNEDNHNLQISYIVNGETKTYTMEVNRGSVVIDLFETNEKGLISGTENVIVSSAEYDGRQMTKLEFTSMITGDPVKDAEYLSQVLLDVDGLLDCIDVAAGYTLDVYNPTDEAITINLYYETAVLDKPIETITIDAHGFRTLSFYDLESLKKALNIIIRVQNTGTVDAPDVYTLLISNLKYVKG